SAHLAIMDGRDVVYLVTERPPLTIPLVVDIGVRLPVHLTASGRALLARQTNAQMHATYPDRRALPLRTGVGPTSPRALRTILDEVRRDGVGREDGEIDVALASVAVACLDHAGRAVAAVTLTFPSAGHGETERAALVLKAQAAADLLTVRLGG
ncbi:MAG: DNA-binding IclR family transcriptional regulator, partial [Glaciecola sp.]